MEYRHLTTEEIAKLEANGCESEDWNGVLVSIDTEEMDFRSVRFVGEVRVGKACRLRNVTLSHSTADHIKRVNVLDESGGRSVPICRGLSAQVAYMLAFYRHDKQLTQKIEALIHDVCDMERYEYLHIGEGTYVCNVGNISNAFIGEYCHIEGATELINGTLGDGAKVLSGAYACDFVIESGATLGVSCILKSSFLGQGARLNNGFIAKHSLIFSNSVLEGGEAVSLFAGPHTVSDHRNTLLIGASTLFFNAGSGTNHSNHAYRTGPVHHGIYERGCKTASNSHMVWPARVGQYSVVFGSHYDHPETSKLPFSYLFSKDGKTTVVPAANLTTFGLLRDTSKWRRRGKRDGEHRWLDCINYDGVAPNNVERMAQGIELLADLQDGSLQISELNFHISPQHIERGIKLYDMEIRYFIGNKLVHRIVNLPADNLSMEALMHCEGDAADINNWVDMMGMVAPRSVVDNLCQRIVEGDVSGLEMLNCEVTSIHGRYSHYCWQYVHHNMKRFVDIDPDTATATDLKTFIQDWRGTVQVLRALRLADAQKDFTGNARVGFGIDHPEFADADFLNVRGTMDDDSYVQDIRDYYARDEQSAQKAIEMLAQFTR